MNSLPRVLLDSNLVLRINFWNSSPVPQSSTGGLFERECIFQWQASLSAERCVVIESALKCGCANPTAPFGRRGFASSFKSAGTFLEADARAAIIQKLYSRTFQRDLHSKERSGVRLDWPVKRLHAPDGADGDFSGLCESRLAPAQ